MRKAKQLISAIFIVLLACLPIFADSTDAKQLNGAKIQRELKQILSSPDYNRIYGHSAFDKSTQRLGEAASHAIIKFFKWLGRNLSFGSNDGAKAWASAATWAVVVAFFALVCIIVWRLIKSNNRHAHQHSGDECAEYEFPSAKPLIKQAAMMADAGNYRAAFRAAYIASIAYLDGVCALRFERSRTNWEYMRELKRGGHEKPYLELQPITLDFDRKIYGRETCTMQDYLNAAAVYEHLSSEEAK